MPDPSCCPTRDQLRRFLAGQMAEDAAEQLAGHVSDCSVCSHALAQLESPKTVLDAIQRQAGRSVEREGNAGPASTERPGNRPAVPSTVASPPATQDLPPATVAWEATAEEFGAEVTPGERRGKYSIIKAHAQGGLGQVSLARDEKLGRQVALKEIRPDRQSDVSLRQRFVTEAEITGQLEHPGIVPIYALDEDDQGRPYYTMRFIEGRTLAEAIRDSHANASPLFFRELLQRFVTVCQTIAYAHSKGVIHRDLKPANVMLGQYGETLVVDWGLAKKLATADPTDEHEPSPVATATSEGQVSASDLALTTAGQVLGTPAYMSPEQAAGHSDQVGPATDIYALGAILYEILTGRSPYSNSKNVGEVLSQLAGGVLPPPPSQVRAGVPRPLEAVCRKAMAHSPADRYSTAQELAAEVERWLADEPLSCYRESWPARAARWSRRHKAWVQAAVSALALIAVVAIVAAILIDQQKREKEQLAIVANNRRIEAEDRDKEARFQWSRAEEQLSRAERLLYVNQIAAALRDWESGDARAAWENWNACRADLRGWEHDYLYALFTQDQRTLQGHTAAVTGVAFDSEGTRLASSSDDGTVKLWDLATDKNTVTMKEQASPASCLAFHPEGTAIVSGYHDGLLVLWDAATGALLRKFVGHKRIINCVAFSPDGRHIASGSEDTLLKIWDAATGKPVHTIQTPRRVAGVAYSPDGKWIASCARNKDVTIWDAATGREFFSLPGHPSSVLCLSYSPDGKQLITGAADRLLRLWDLPSNAQQLPPALVLNLPRSVSKFFVPVKHVYEGHANRISSVAFDRDGKQIATGSFDKTVRLWDAETGKATSFKGHTDAVLSVAISPDGKQVASGSSDTTIRLWDTAVRRDTNTFIHTAAVRCLSISPDGQQIVSGSDAKVAKLWDVAARKFKYDAVLGWLVLRHEQRIDGTAFSPDGKQFVTASWDKTIKLWDATTGHCVHTLSGHKGHVVAVAFGSDGRIVSGSADATLKLWDAVTGQELHTMAGHSAEVTSVAFTRDGRHIASGSLDQRVKLWDAATGKEVRTLEGHTGPVYSLALHPDGKHLASGSGDASIKVWNLDTGTAVATLTGHAGGVMCVAFSPDGRRLVSGSEDLSIKLWDTATGQTTITLTGHQATVTCAAFSPNGRWLATGSEDQTLKIWDAARSE